MLLFVQLGARNTIATTCDDVIKACDTALADKQTAIDKLTLVNNQQDWAYKDLRNVVDEKDAQLASIWHNTFIMIGVGLVGGILLVK